jgi:hypothetical protein
MSRASTLCLETYGQPRQRASAGPCQGGIPPGEEGA